MEDWKLGYLAGMIDGEGCISISRSGTSLNCSVTVSNTYLPVLEFLQKEFGGNIHTDRSGRITPAHILRWSGNKGKGILTLVSGKLIIKKERAELYLLFLLPGKGSRKPYRDEILQIREREDVYLKMKELNRRPTIECSEPKEISES